MTAKPIRDGTDVTQGSELEPLLRLWPQATEFRTLVEAFQRGPSSQLAYGLGGSQRTFLVAGLLRQLSWPCLYVVPTAQHGERIAADLEALIPGLHTLTFPNLEILPYDVLAQGPDLPAARLVVLRALLAAASEATNGGPSAPGDGSPGSGVGTPRASLADRSTVNGGPLVIIAPLAALTRKLPPPGELAVHAFRLRRGRRYDLQELAARLVAAGYERIPTVEAPGGFAVRGGVLDLYPFTAAEPVRAEFFGDELESLRPFDPTSQRSTGDLDRVDVAPASEFLPGPERREREIEEIQAELARQTGNL